MNKPQKAIILEISAEFGGFIRASIGNVTGLNWIFTRLLSGAITPIWVVVFYCPIPSE